MSAAPESEGLRVALRGLGQWQRGKRRGSAFVFVAAILMLACLGAGAVGALSAARAFVGGESLYSNSQKKAVRWLGQYLRSGNEADYARYAEALALPLGDRVAQLELERPRSDDAIVRRGLLQGGNDPGDLALMIACYRLFRAAPPMADAIEAWASADAQLVRLAGLAERIRALHAGAVPAAAAPGLEAEMLRIDDRLDAEESRFARRLGDAARWVQGLLLAATAGLALTLIASGLLFARMMWLRLAQSQGEAEAVNLRWALAAEAGNIGLVEWRMPDDTALLDPRAVAIYELSPAPGGLYPASALRARIHADDSDAFRQAKLQAVANGTGLFQRFRAVLPAAGLRTLQVDGRPFMADGHTVSHLVGLVRDVTDEVTAQDALLEESAARRSHEARREFLSRVSHELRTPLNAVIGFSDLMRSDGAEPLTPTQAARLDRVVDGGQHLLRLVNDLLDVARLEAGEMRVALGSVALAPVLRGAADVLETLRAARGIVLDVGEAPASLCVLADAVRLKQMFVNILSNAIKHSRPAGRVHVGVAQTPTQAVLTVRDEGAGMTPQQQRELFTPFRRFEADVGATPGAGLGLVISRLLAERQGGSLDVASEPGRGTTVTIRLPRDPDVDCGPVAADTSAPSATGAADPAGLVVYIEDDPVNALLMEQYMMLFPQVRLRVATDGATGLALAHRWRPDLILLDMQLPDMSGLDVLDRLRGDGATRDLRVVALSADAMPAQVSEAIARGAEAYWTKPLSLTKFRSELPKYLNRSAGSGALGARPPHPWH